MFSKPDWALGGVRHFETALNLNQASGMVEVDRQRSKNTRGVRGRSEGYLKESIDRETIGVGHVGARGGD